MGKLLGLPSWVHHIQEHTVQHMGRHMHSTKLKIEQMSNIFFTKNAMKKHTLQTRFWSSQPADISIQVHMLMTCIKKQVCYYLSSQAVHM
jgi:hypothetical protein